MKTQKENDIDSLFKANKLDNREILKSVTKELYSRNKIGEMELIENEVMAKMFPIGQMFNYSGGYYINDEMVDFEIQVLISQVDDGEIWVTNDEGDEFPVYADSLSKVRGG